MRGSGCVTCSLAAFTLVIQQALQVEHVIQLACCRCCTALSDHARAWVQASFHIFGMELLATLDVQSMHEFFETFFTLPDRFWRGFLASKLSSVDLMTFASLMFVKCSMGIRGKLMQHLLTNPAGRYLLRTYTKELRGKLPGGNGGKIERKSE